MEKEELQRWILDYVDNANAPKDFEGSHDDWKRNELYSIADTAVDLAQAIKTPVN